ncbi:hypothetical protein HY26_17915 [Hyphomonas sp. GM-8P]|nr:hypothetical protein HY26_17915 [Hyphomonas sp. GM-8P]
MRKEAAASPPGRRERSSCLVCRENSDGGHVVDFQDTAGITDSVAFERGNSLDDGDCARKVSPLRCKFGRFLGQVRDNLITTHNVLKGLYPIPSLRCAFARIVEQNGW